MGKATTTIIDIGSSKITVIVGEPGKGAFRILGSGESEYAGFLDGEFLEDHNLRNALAMAMSNAEVTSNTKISRVFVGVPAAFCLNVCKNSSLEFNKPKQIFPKDIFKLINLANEFNSVNSHSVISASPVCFILDDNKRITDPYNEVARKIEASLSFILVENNFLKQFNGILNSMGVVVIKYLSSSLCQALYLIDANKRDKYSVIIDSGHITTSVSLVRGEGLLLLNEFSVGGGHITGDLMQCLKMSYNDCDLLKRKVVLTLAAKDNDVYELKTGNSVYPVYAGITNDIVTSRIEHIAHTIQTCLNNSSLEIPNNAKFYLTGGGLCYIKGAKEVLSKILNKTIEILLPNVAQLEKPHYTSSLSVLDIAIKNNLKENGLTTLFYLN